MSHGPRAWPCLGEDGTELRDTGTQEKGRATRSTVGLAGKGIVRGREHRLEERMEGEAKAGRVRRGRKGTDEGQRVWGRREARLLRGLVRPASVCPPPQLLSCAFMGCALLYRVNDADVGHRIKGSWSRTQRGKGSESTITHSTRLCCGWSARLPNSPGVTGEV